mgnify:CR=1 FL=1
MDKESFWAGSLPEKCDLCGDSLKRGFWDARSRQGHWMIVCIGCHNDEVMSSGTGHGQRYEKQKDGSWMRVEG